MQFKTNNRLINYFDPCTGLAYTLKLLDQYSDFDALHWFQSVQKKYVRDIEQQKGQLSDNSSSRRGRSNKKTAEEVEEEEKLLQTKTLALKRIEIYRKVDIPPYVQMRAFPFYIVHLYR